MYIKSEEIISNFKRLSKLGNLVEYQRTKKLHYFKCDNCKKDFSRDISKIGHQNLNNNVKHFCSDCNDPKLKAKVSQDARRKNLKRKYNAKLGNKLLTAHGYVEVCVGNETQYSGVRKGYIREHVKVMQDNLGRQLIKGEIVHHVDGDKINNDISNLDLCTISEHNNAHAKIEQIVFELVKQGKVGYDRVTKRYFLLNK